MCCLVPHTVLVGSGMALFQFLRIFAFALVSCYIFFSCIANMFKMPTRVENTIEIHYNTYCLIRLSAFTYEKILKRSNAVVCVVNGNFERK